MTLEEMEALSKGWSERDAQRASTQDRAAPKSARPWSPEEAQRERDRLEKEEYGDMPNNTTECGQGATFEVNPWLFSAVRVAQQKNEETRHYLNGVHITPSKQGGVYLVATDGCMMLVAHDKDGVASEPCIVTTVLNDAQLKKFGKDHRKLNNSMCEYINGTFPDWRRPMPRTEWLSDTFSFNFDATLMTKVQKAGRLSEGRGPNEGVYLCVRGSKTRTGNNMGPFVVGIGNERLFAIVMPIRRGSTPEVGYPEWFGWDLNEYQGVARLKGDEDYGSTAEEKYAAGNYVPFQANGSLGSGHQQTP